MLIDSGANNGGKSSNTCVYFPIIADYQIVIYIIGCSHINSQVIVRTDPHIQYYQYLLTFTSIFTGIILASFVSGNKNQQFWDCPELFGT